MSCLKFAAIVLAATSTGLAEGKPVKFPKGALPEGKLNKELLETLAQKVADVEEGKYGDHDSDDDRAAKKIIDKAMVQAVKDYSKMSTKSWKDRTQHEILRTEHDRRQRALMSAEGKRMIQQHWPKLSKKGYKIVEDEGAGQGSGILTMAVQMHMCRHREGFVLEEFIPEVVHQSPTGSEGRVKYLPLPPAFLLEDDMVDARLRPIVEKFVKQDEVNFVSVYGGIRVYEAGASEQMHLNSPDKVITVIIPLFFSGDGDKWPLKIHKVENDPSTAKSVILKDGEAFIYEGGRMVVGRPDPLSSGSAAFIYAHFAPQDDIVDVKALSQRVEELMSTKPSQEEL